MNYAQWKGFCLAAEEPGLFPPEAEAAEGPFPPLVLLTSKNPYETRGMFAIESLDEFNEAEGPALLLPLRIAEPLRPMRSLNCERELEGFVAQHGATVLNVAFTRAFSLLEAFQNRKRSGLKITLVGLGDVGGTVLTGLKLLGRELSEISIFDMNPAACERYCLELNQVIPDEDGRVMPKVTVCAEESLFDCDLFLFTASRGVPGLGTDVKDVRMAQFDANRKMLDIYAKKAREADYRGLFCQISDPVDHLSREVFLASNRNEAGEYDWQGLLPEQVQGFGLGVMAARAAFYAEQRGIAFDNGRVYGPHGQGLIAANSPAAGYDDEASIALTEDTKTANLRVRDLGFKPYIAPGLSSAAISVLRLVRGQVHYGAIPMGGVYFGCRNVLTGRGFRPVREALNGMLFERISDTYRSLKEFQYE